MENEKLIRFANQLADISGKIIKKYFRKPLATEYKKAESPIVTIADKEVELALRKYIQLSFPDHGIIGEEFGNINKDAEYQWALDPIDGTIAFACGKPLFGTLISLIKNGKHILGIIDQPILKERWVGTGSRTTLNSVKCKTSSIKDINKARLSTTTPRMFKEPKHKKAFQNLSDSTRITTFGGDCYIYALLASGHIDIVIERTLQLHDYAALIPIIEGAGGIVTDWSGNTVGKEGHIIASANKDLHKKALKFLE